MSIICKVSFLPAVNDLAFFEPAPWPLLTWDASGKQACSKRKKKAYPIQMSSTVAKPGTLGNHLEKYR